MSSSLRRDRQLDQAVKLQQGREHASRGAAIEHRAARGYEEDLPRQRSMLEKRQRAAGSEQRAAAEELAERQAVQRQELEERHRRERQAGRDLMGPEAAAREA